MLGMILAIITAMTIIFEALAVMAKAQIKAVSYLTEAFIATVDFAKIVWRFFRTLVQKICRLRKRK
ncbi:hypothetical protein [Lactobacillus sp. LL6]|uniref:hypothetical protein n=1 Tax=Lactobacillus sp. LL6 TaxID=2596827 RepID=UPI001186D367|nr:hypothetical protein [Lactobacillus sp. LL6]TSO25566.1 hypothetical protein FOD82_00320 [Lactobacillus sp. LL6]